MGILHDILRLKHEKANMLNFPDYAHLSTSTKMAKTPEKAQHLLDQLYPKALAKANQDLNELFNFARQSPEIRHALHTTEMNVSKETIKPWDLPFMRQKYRESLFGGLNDEAIAAYFPLETVISGMFKIAKEAFGIDVKQIDFIAGQRVPRWNSDVRVYEVSQQSNPIAYFYADLYCRPQEKRPGAWMDILSSRRRMSTGDIQLPIAYLICNQAPPVTPNGASPTKFDEVTTLFHEFGHCLQHMLTTVDYPQASGVC